MLRGTGAAHLRHLRNVVQLASRVNVRLSASGGIGAGSRPITATSCRSTTEPENGRSDSLASASMRSRSSDRIPRLRDGVSPQSSARQRRRSPPPQRQSRRHRPTEGTVRAEGTAAVEEDAGEPIEVEEAWQSWEIRRGEDGDLNRALPSFCRKMSRALLRDTDKHPTDRLEVLANDFHNLQLWNQTVPILARLVMRERYDFVLQKVEELINADQFTDRQFEAWTPLLMLACKAANNLGKSPVKKIVALVKPQPPKWFLPRTLVPNKGQQRTHLNGCPLLHSIVDPMIEFGGVPIEITELDKQTYRHAVLAWGLGHARDDADDGARQSSLIVHRIMTAAGDGHHDALVDVITTLQEAAPEWLSVAYNDDPKADWNAKAWSALLNALLSKKDHEAATKTWALYNSMKPAKQSIHPALWNGLLSGYSAAGEWDRAQAVWTQMRSVPDAFDQYCYASMITVLFRSRQPFEAQLLYQEMLEWTAKRREVLSVASMNSLIHGLATNDRLEEAARIATDMIQGADKTLPSPNIGTINTLLRAYGRANNLEGIVQALRAMGQLDLRPDVVTFTTVLDAFARMGKGEYVNNVYDIMLAQGTEGNAVTLTAIIKNALENQTDRSQPARFDMALSMLQRMESIGPKPTEVTYTNIISAFFDHAVQLRQEIEQGLFHKAYNLQAVRKTGIERDVDVNALWPYRPEVVTSMLLVGNMRQRRMPPNRKTYHTLFGGILKPYYVHQAERTKAGLGGLIDLEVATQNVNLGSLRCASGVLKHMKQSGLPMNDRSLTIFAQGLERFTHLNDGAVTAMARKILEAAKRDMSTDQQAKLDDLADRTTRDVELEK